VAVWSVNGRPTFLATSVVSSSQITATVPANLLSTPIVALVWVETYKGQDDMPSSTTRQVPFTVSARVP